MDWLGAFFSLMALVVQHTFDILGGVLYICCIMLEAGIFLSHFIWLIRTRKLRKQAKEAGMDFDDLPEAQRYRVTVDVESRGEDKPLDTEKKRGWKWRKKEVESPGLGPESPGFQETAIGVAI